MSFNADWLALREPADVAARSSRLAQVIAEVLAANDPTRALDLGAGTGANARYLAGYLPGRQDWLLVDNDPALLARATAPLASADSSRCRVETRQLDLVLIKDGAAEGLFDGRTLVTASALLDLVSEGWLREMAARCREHGAAVLFALTYDGRIQCLPEEPQDELIRELVNRHQRTDKGFGPALGPAAAAVAERTFLSLGYEVRRERSDWVLAPAAGGLQRSLLEGWAQAAAAIAPAEAMPIRNWLARRLAHVDANRSQIIVGHEDLAGWINRIQ